MGGTDLFKLFTSCEYQMDLKINVSSSFLGLSDPLCGVQSSRAVKVYFPLHGALPIGGLYYFLTGELTMCSIP